MCTETGAVAPKARAGVRLTLSSEKDRGGQPNTSEESDRAVISRHSCQGEGGTGKYPQRRRVAYSRSDQLVNFT